MRWSMGWLLWALWGGCTQGTDDVAPTDDLSTTDTPTGDTGTPTTKKTTLPTDAVMAGAVIDCETTLPPAPKGASCAVQGELATATHLLLQGDVLGDLTSFEGGSVLVELGPNALITCAGCDCPAPESTLTVSCPDAVISPGLINPHDHIGWATDAVSPHGTERYDHRHDWRTGDRDDQRLSTRSDRRTEAMTYGELRMMLAGATSLVGSGGSAGLLRNLDRADLNEGLGGWAVDYSTFPLGDSDGTLASSGCDAYRPEGDRVLDQRIYMPHISEGIDSEANNEFQCLSSSVQGAADLIADNTSIVHGIGMRGDDVALVASRGAHLVWSPRSNLSLYGDTAPVVTYDQLGVPIALGTDWVPSGSSTMLRELACADRFNQEHLGGHFSDRDLWLMATRGAAYTMGADGQLGRIRPGFIADLTVFDKGERALHRAVLEAGIDDVALVLRGGVPMTGQSALVGALRADAEACEALADCVSDHVVCMDGRHTLAEVLAAVSPDAYPLYICDVPADEPTCEPSRDDEDGDGVIYPTSSPTDADLDGVDDGVDNCPAIFNPPRPVDLWMQADTDLDGSGDACDPCPTDAEDGCRGRDPDRDTVEGLDDNCPDVRNPQQEDADGDLIGDACDACPDYPSTQGACPVPIEDVKQGQHDGVEIALLDMLVTGIAPSGFYLQLDPSSIDYTTPDFTGIYVYAPGLEPAPAVGDAITIEGIPSNFYGQLQLTNVGRWIRQSAGNPPPAPVDATPAEVATKGSRAEALEAMLVRVADVEITELDLPPGPGDASPTHEFEVDDVLAVDDLLYRLDPEPQLGESITSIAGVLRFGNDASKLTPRDLSDYAFGATTLVGLIPDPVYLEAGVSSSASLAVQLLRASTVAQSVSLSCGPTATLTCPASLLVPAGQTTASLPLTGGAASIDPATVAATLNGSKAAGLVLVYDDSLPRSVVSLTPDPLKVLPKASDSLVVTLDMPAPTTGVTVILSSIGSALDTVPASVTVPAGSLAEAFTITAGAKVGDDEVTATLGPSSASATVQVSDAGEGLIFSEYVEGSFGNNKFVEITNLEGGDFDLKGCEVEVYSNGGLAPSNTIGLTSGTLASGAQFLLCHSASTIKTGTSCDQSAGTLNFNGNDVVRLVCPSGVQDVIGQIGNNPGAGWGTKVSTVNSVLRRSCDVEIGDRDGADVFVPEDEWSAATTDDGSNLGLPHCP